MKRLIVLLVIAGMFFGTMLLLDAPLPLTGETAESDAIGSNTGSGLGGISLMGSP